MTHLLKIAFARRICLPTLLVVGITVPFTTISAKQPPHKVIQQSADLQELKHRIFDHVEVSPALRAQGKAQGEKVAIYIDTPTITFDDEWRKNHRLKTTESYEKKTLARYQKVFKKALTDAFTEDERFAVTDAPENALQLTANIEELDIYAPDIDPTIKQYVNHAGEAKLNATLLDTNGKVLAKVSDKRETKEVHMWTPQKTNSLLNQRDFRFLMEKWSNQLAKLIKEG